VASGRRAGDLVSSENPAREVAAVTAAPAGPPPRMCLILSENWTMTSGRDLPALVRWAREAEDAGFDSVMISEHIVLGPSAGADGIMGNPREYALPGNQDPATPWPSSLVLLSAIAAVTERIRLVAGAVIAPLRHPLVLARELGSLDLLSGGRLVVLPTVSWLREEYEALGVPFRSRGDLLDEHLQSWATLWRETPASFEGAHYAFRDVYFEPKAFRPSGPQLWLGGAGMHRRMTDRIVTYGDGFNPLGRPTEDQMQRLRAAMAAARRDMASLELVGGTRALFRDATGTADLGEALAVIEPQIEAGFSTFCIKPSQFTDDPMGVGAFCREVVRRVDRLQPRSITL
jgi:probable F420-dependent oxidoreductase